jgi:aspartate kinase
MKTDRPVTGVALDTEHARINVIGVPDQPGWPRAIFDALGAAGVSADMIIQGVPGAGDSRQQMSFTVPVDLAHDAVEAVRPVLAPSAAASVAADTDVAKLSIVGIAIGSTPGIAGRMFAAVASIGANIEMIATSEVRISVVIPRSARTTRWQPSMPRSVWARAAEPCGGGWSRCSCVAARVASRRCGAGA